MNYRKITKPVARRLFNDGREVYLLPCKVSAAVLTCEHSWIQACIISKKKDGEFDKAVNSFEYFNCNNEAGTYSHYYIKEE